MSNRRTDKSNMNDFNTENGTLMKYKGKDPDVVIPDSVTSIGEGAFCNCDSIVSITVPAGVVSVGIEAFENCRNLREILLPEGLLSIDTFAFNGCKKLKAINIPSSVKKVEWGAFRACESLEQVVFAAEAQLSNHIFEGCNSLQSLVLPDGTTIDDVIHADIPTDRVIPIRCFTKSSEFFKGMKPAYIKDFAMGFAQNRQMYPADSAEIHKKMIKSRSKTLGPFALDIGSAALIGVLLETGGINDQILQAFLDEAAAKGLTELSAMLLDRMDKQSASGAKEPFGFDLDKPTKESLPIRNEWETHQLSNSGECSVARYIGNSDSITVPAKIRNKLVAEIDEYAFAYRKEKWIIEKNENLAHMKSVVIADGVRYIGKNAFAERDKLVNVTLPGSIERIEEYAFWGCENLESINMPSGIKHIGTGAFRGCKKLADKDGFVISAGILFDYFGHTASISVPDGVTDIDDEALSDTMSMPCVSVTKPNEALFSSVTIPNSVNRIGRYAFGGCKNLTSVQIPNSVVSIRERIFEGCSSLAEVSLPVNLTEIPYAAFSKCSKLKSIVIPPAVKEIRNSAFHRCWNLKTLEIPETVETISASAFTGCDKLANKAGYLIIRNVLYAYTGKESEVTVPDGVAAIGYGAFYHDSRIREVTVPDGVTRIEAMAFMYCDNLEALYLPESLTEIKTQFGHGWENAFEGCSKLTIHAPNGSCAGKYAKKKLIPFEAND